MINKDYLERFLSGEFVVNCRTEQEAREFLDVLEKRGITWAYEKSNTNTEWNNYKTDTCYNIEDGRLFYGPKDYFINSREETVLVYPGILEPTEPSKFAKLAELLGVELGEEFYIEDCGNQVYKITEEGLTQYFTGLGEYMLSYLTFNAMLKHQITKKPWKPENGDGYCKWSGSPNGISVVQTTFNDWYIEDLRNYKIGNCFRSHEECEAATDIRDKMEAEYKEMLTQYEGV